MNNLYGLIGSRLSHSLSKNIHSSVFEILGIDAYYHLFEVAPANIEQAVLGLNALGAVGINVTIPYKCDIMKYLDEISEEAKKIGAVNTVKFQKGRMIGYNTDYFGFKAMLEKNEIPVKGKKIVILGSGGAADAVLQYFMDDEVGEIYVISRKIQGTKLKYKQKDAIICNYDDIQILGKADIIVNCTPCGMYPSFDEFPMEMDVLKNFGTAIDLVYNPMETKFLKNATNYGLKTINGLYMLVAQGIASQEIWNNITIDSKVIEAIYDSMRNTDVLYK